MKTQHTDKQIPLSKFDLLTQNHGLFELEAMGSIPSSVDKATLPTGQRRSTGRTPGVDVSFTLLAGDDEQCMRMELWLTQVQSGTPAYIDSATLIGYQEDGTVGMSTEIVEIFPSDFATPEYSTDSSEVARRAGSFSVWGAKSVHS